MDGRSIPDAPYHPIWTGRYNHPVPEKITDSISASCHKNV